MCDAENDRERYSVYDVTIRKNGCVLKLVCENARVSHRERVRV